MIPTQFSTGQRPPEAAGRRAVWLAVAALAMAFLLPIGGLVLGALALTTGIRALGELRRAGKSTGTAITGIVLGTISSLIALFYTVLQLYFAPELSAYNECRLGAGTVAAQHDCQEQLERALEKKIPFLNPGDLQLPF